MPNDFQFLNHKPAPKFGSGSAGSEPANLRGTFLTFPVVDRNRSIRTIASLPVSTQFSDSLKHDMCNTYFPPYVHFLVLASLFLSSSFSCVLTFLLFFIKRNASTKHSYSKKRKQRCAYITFIYMNIIVFK